jgi:hypothetical protein
LKPVSDIERKLATRPFFVAWNRNHDVFHENMLPYICSFYDTGFKVLSRYKVAYIHGKLHDFYPMQWRNYADYESISLSLYFFTPASEVCPWKLATSHSFIAWDVSHDVFHENKLPYICSIFNLLFFHIFRIFSLINLHFFHIFHIISLFNLLF